MTIYFLLIFLPYLLFLIVVYLKWKNLREIFSPEFNPLKKVTVIIPVRNEADNIQLLLQDLQLQTYPLSLLQVLVMNDHSTDATEILANEMISGVDYDLQVINLQLPDNFSGSSKKMAITQAITLASGEIIVTTDGDCRLQKEWLTHLCYPLEVKDAVLVAAPVTFTGERSFFHHLQTIEFSSLIVTGAVSMVLHRPNMCNGANLAYQKMAFIRVNGYDGNQGIASGDDEFLLQKISRAYSPDRIRYQKSRKAIVFTAPQENWKQFAQQRKRWAGKWKKHKNIIVMMLAAFIFLFHLSFIGAVIYVLSLSYFSGTIFTFIFIKILLEFILLKNALEFLNKKLNLLKFIVLQILYPFYVVYFGIAANFGTFSWKGRNYKN